MVKKILFSIFILAQSGIIFSQSYVQKSYDIGNDDYGNQIQYTGNNTLAVCGSTNFVGAGGYDAFIMSFDTTGTVLWEKQYGGSNTEYGASFTYSNNSFALTGRTNSFSSNNSQDILLLRAANNGATLWAKSYRTDSIEYGQSVASTSDGGYIVTGQTTAGGLGARDMFLLKTDSNGVVSWMKAYGSTGNDVGTLVMQTGDGGYVVVGYSDGGTAGRQDAYLVKTDSAGGIQAQLLLGGVGDDEALGLSGTSQNAIILAGTTASNQASVDQIFVASINTSTFTLNWAKQYGGGVDDQLASIKSTGTGYVIAGTSSSFGNGKQGLVFEIDTLGNVTRSKTIGGAGDDFIQDVLPVGDGSEVLTGNTTSFGGVANNVYLARTLPNGNLCSNYQSPVNLTVTSWAATLAGPVLNDHTDSVSTITTTSLTLTENSYTPTTHDICGSIAALAVNAGRDTSLCSNLQQIATLGGNTTVTGGTGPFTYSWSPATNLSGAAVSNPTVTPTGTGTVTYVLMVTDQSTNATATDTVVVTATICSGIDEVLADNLISIFPNPNNGSFQMNFDRSVQSVESLNVYDLSGKLVLTRTNLTPSMVSIDMKQAAMGCYTLEVRTDKGVIHKKLIVQ